MRILLALCLAAAVLAPLRAQSPLGESLKDIPLADHWIYDDFPKAVAEAKASKKPILVVIRCVPCPPGKMLDVAVATPDKSLEAIEKQFVCVRLIQTNNLDLELFQYDYDMSWAAMFLTPDLAVLGRYGTRAGSQANSDTYLSTAGFTKAAERALDLFKNYPENASELAGKKGARPQYAKAAEIPGLSEKPAVATVKQNCVHCHMLKEFALRAKWEAGQLTKDDVYLYPLPQNIGLTIDKDDGLLVASVAAGSPADKAGIQAGDVLAALGSQPLISMADIQWVLNAAPADGSLTVNVLRGGQPLSKTLALSGDWKKSDIAWRASSWYGLRHGVKFDPLSAADKEKRGLSAGQLALLTRNIYSPQGKGPHAALRAGLKQNDVIVAVDGKTDAMSESDFLVYLRTAHGPKDSVKFTILRGDERRELTIPMW
jgi:serine protease Do